jgi:ATP-dependent DNA helicase RecG
VAIDLQQLQELMDSRENEHLEFKEAKNHFDFELLVKYCAALANEGGGNIILGVTDKHPRIVVGSQAFENLERTKSGLIERLHLRINASVVNHPNGQVIAFEVPSRPIGYPIQYGGAYWMRSGDTLVPMTPDMLKRIFDESGPDYSAEICSDVTISDLDSSAIKIFRQKWFEKSRNESLLHFSDEQLLADAELTIDGRVTFAALILFGSQKALTRCLPQSEFIFEYRSGDASGGAQQRIEYRKGYFLFQDELWQTINLRNDIQHFHEGLFLRDIKTFNEIAVREAIQNAVSHRDYRMAGSIFVRQYPRRIEFVSPGGFPPGITLQNIIWKQAPRNRRIAEALSRCGMVERSGQGINLMYEECIRESKPRPDFTGTDDYQVAVTLHGTVQDPKFVKFLEQIGQERLSTFMTQDFLLLDMLNREQPIPDELKARISYLVEQGAVERHGRGRGARYILSRRFYDFIGKKGAYTRKRGLDRETNKALLLKHIVDNKKTGSQLNELKQVLPSLTGEQVRTLLKEMRTEDAIYCVGHTKSAKWYPKEM